MFDRIRPCPRPWALLAAIALVAFNAACTSAPPAAGADAARADAAAPAAASNPATSEHAAAHAP